MSVEGTFFIRDVLRGLSAGDHRTPIFGSASDAASVFAITGLQAISDTRASLDEVDDENWNWERWFGHAISSGSFTIGVRGPDTSKIVGFCSIDREAFVATSPFSGIIDLNLEITSVYVRPDYRGQGFATILREAAAAHLRSIIDIIASIPEQDIADHGLAGLSVTVSSFPESQEGHAFANRISGEVEAHLAAISETSWFGQAVFIDETDPEEEPSPT